MIDPYDVAVAFDDLYGEAAPSRSPVEAARAMARRVALRRLNPPPVVIGAARGRDGVRSFAVEKIIVGDSGGGPPLFTSIRDRFAAALPSPKVVRFDDVESYRDFREERRRPRVAELESRLAALEDAFRRHIDVDHHGDSVLRAVEEVACGGLPIALPPAIADKVDCWQDGREVCMTARVLDPRGCLRSVTTGLPLERAIGEVLGAAIICDERGECDLEDVLPVVPDIARQAAVARLLPEVCRAAEAGRKVRGRRFLGVMVPACDPSLAAAMALLQRCQGGDRAACREVEICCASSSGGVLFAEALDRLIRAQREKARRS